MPRKMIFLLAFLEGLLLVSLGEACCPAPPFGKAVVNADQSVIIIWDEAKQTQHFVRRATFKSEANQFGFLIPSPSEPELNESGNEAFPYLQKLTEPEVTKVAKPSGGGCIGCAAAKNATFGDVKAQVEVLQEKEVAGFKASVLKADSSQALMGWLKDNGFAFSPEVEAWAKPYIGGDWKITAFKVIKKEKDETGVNAAALRMSFKTTKPLFPYREPDSSKDAQTLNAKDRLLRIYFIADARFRGELTKESPWTGKAVWCGMLTRDQQDEAVKKLNLPADTGPAKWVMTEFEDHWPYRVAPADLYFAKDDDQNLLKRPPIIIYTGRGTRGDFAAMGVICLACVPLLLMFRRS